MHAGKTYDSQVCSIARALEVIGERWSLLIVRDALFAGSTRYSDFQRGLGIATNMLKSRLDSFVEAGIMRRHRYSEQPELYEYLLTDKGRSLAHALVALSEWGDQWATDGNPRSSTPTRRAAAESPSRQCAPTAAASTIRPRSRPRSGLACPPTAYRRRLDRQPDSLATAPWYTKAGLAFAD